MTKFRGGVLASILILGALIPASAQTPSWTDCRVEQVQKSYNDGDHKILIRCEPRAGDPVFSVGLPLNVSPKAPPACTVGFIDNWTVVSTDPVCKPTGTRTITESRTAVVSPAGCSPVPNPLPTETRTREEPCTPPPTCTYSLDYTSYNYPTGGGNVRLFVTTQPTCAWTPVSDSSWLTVNSGSGPGSGEVLAFVSGNTGPPRSGKINIANVSFTANQDGPVACTPVNCVWGPFEGPWVEQSNVCSGTTRTIVERQFRSVATPASCGGVACSGLNYQERTRTETCSNPGGTQAVLAPSDLILKGFYRIPMGPPLWYSRGGLAMRSVGGQMRLFTLDDEADTPTPNGLLEFAIPAAPPNLDYTIAPLLTQVKNWGSVFAGRMSTHGGGGYSSGIYWDASRNAVWLTYGEGYIPRGHDPSLTVAVINDSNQTAQGYGPWRFQWGSQMTRGPVMSIDPAFAAAYTGGKTTGVLSHQASGNFGSPFGMVLSAFALPNPLTTPADSPTDGTDWTMTNQGLIQHDIAHPQARDTNHQLHRWNVKYDCTQGATLVPGGGVWGGPDTATGENDTLTGGVWIDLPDKRGVLFLGQLAHGHFGYGDPYSIGASPKTDCLGAYDAWWYGTGPYAETRTATAWIYDPLDFIATAQGKANLWSLTPKHVMNLPALYPQIKTKYPSAMLGGSYFDAATRQLYILLKAHDTVTGQHARPVLMVFEVRQ